MEQRKKILLAPLDWGLGHATRCIPVIRELLNQNAEVIIAADKGPFDLLKNEFPGLAFLRLPGYNIHYSDSGSLAWTMMRQLSKIRKSIRHEHDSLQHMIGFYKINGVISDNRFGLYTEKIPSVFITHQVRILMPASWKWLEKTIYRRNLSFINQYAQCWIPDVDSTENISGDLSHSFPLPRNAQYIGPLSRFSAGENTVTSDRGVLAILSGPEPQRSIFETLIINQAKQFQIKIAIAGGKTDGKSISGLPSTIQHHSFLSSGELEKEIREAGVIISRPGYSTIMDLITLKKRNIIFVPTPGQTEQEYLAQKLAGEKKCTTVLQKDFNLEKTIGQSGMNDGFSKEMNYSSQLAQAVQGFLSIC